MISSFGKHVTSSDHIAMWQESMVLILSLRAQYNVRVAFDSYVASGIQRWAKFNIYNTFGCGGSACWEGLSCGSRMLIICGWQIQNDGPNNAVVVHSQSGSPSKGLGKQRTSFSEGLLTA